MLKRGARVREDRISELPKALVCHILSFIPTIEAVRTTVLSKRWNDMWTSVTSLDFDDDRERLPVLIRYLSDADCVEDWICTAVRRTVVELYIYFTCPDKEFAIPRSVFKCKTLRALRLELRCNTILSEFPPSGCFPNLKFLHVTFEYPEVNLPEMLFSHCPAVEDMIIDGVANDIKYVFDVSAPKLKSLRICLVGTSYELDENDVHINTPNLEKLVLERVSLSDYNLENSKSLVSASISFNAISASEYVSFSTCATALLAGISNSYCCSLGNFDGNSLLWVSYLPVFINLKKLDPLLHERNYWEVLAELLSRAPKLEDIVLEDKTKCDIEYSELSWNPPWTAPICLLSHLQTITIKGFKGRKVEMGVAKYLLSKGYVLNKLTLYTGFLYTEAEEMYKKFLTFHRVMSCQVKFIKM
ncbi:putative F-box domain, FBD domain, leucine-rich repeat domain, L domain-containing protein [Rosa chinensis]|uniref:Putative F-box domain, FBD domain, leucine-rich repeat domain, L domain-containing protein n=1 Tax=Rosa chinensis TaxID=74649 RepID=A0A2P6QHR6_ROSCH|nr:putative F-box domain, FBD domain, leucine-rich repeat domain, L domain-containing protein [Rosa chinensis]